MKQYPDEQSCKAAWKRGQNKPTKVGRISSESTIVTDDSSSYTNFHRMFKEHHSQVIPKEQIGKVLPWVHIAISIAAIKHKNYFRYNIT